tara:strand:+ start:297 stop:1517 length:1221 start_codon:yes stop_codon:yes gene_type:complete
MKNLLKIFIISISIINSTYSQELIQVSMGSGYEYDLYYSAEQGITAFSERENWELAFSTNDNNIRINSSYANLYQVSSNIEDWEEINNFDINTSTQLRNSNKEWKIGAFVSNYFDKNPLNYGWGNYNTETEIYEGCRIYIIEYNNEIKKIKINELVDGIFNFTTANLDGSNEENISIDTNPYINKKFIYYSLANNEVVNREPSSENWDLIFTRYEEEYVTLNGDTMPYIVTGVLTNQNLIAQYDGAINIIPNTESLNISTEINTIGYDWKEYSGEFSIVPNRAYYLFSQDEFSLYKILFQSFSGQSSGDLSFTIEEIEDFSPINNINSEKNHLFNISPNPNNGIFNVNLNTQNAVLTIIDINGKIVLKKNINQSLTLNLTNLNEGLFLINLNGEEFNISKRILIQK